MTEAFRLSVVIPTYQRQRSVRRALESLTRQTLHAEHYEVIVAVDGSTDGTTEVLAAVHVPYRLQWLWQPNRGRAAACNAGAKLATGGILVLLDDDMEPESGFLEAHLAAHDARETHAVVGAAPIPSPPGSPPIVAYRAGGFERKLARLSAPGYQPQVTDMYTGNFSVPCAAFRAAGGFDEDFRTYGHEDFDLLRRLVDRGVRLAFSPAARATQHYAKTFEGLAENIIAEGQTAILFAAKHPGTLSELQLGRSARRRRRERMLFQLAVYVSGAWPALPSHVIRGMTWLERRRPRKLARYYDIVFEYLYLYGAERGRRAVSAAKRRDTTPESSTARLDTGSRAQR